MTANSGCDEQILSEREFHPNLSAHKKNSVTRLEIWRVRLFKTFAARDANNKVRILAQFCNDNDDNDDSNVDDDIDNNDDSNNDSNIDGNDGNNNCNDNYDTNDSSNSNNLTIGCQSQQSGAC